MDQTSVAHTIGIVSSLIVALGVTGITSQDLTGFMNVVFALISLGSFVWAHFAHKSAVTA